MRQSLLLVAVIGVGLVHGGCQALDTGFVAQGSSAIIGGDATSDYPSVALIDIGQARCTATLVSETVLVTAAHCVYDAHVGGFRGGGTAYFGPSRSESDAVEIEDLIPHRLYLPNYVREADVGLVRLAEPPPGDITPMAWNRDALEAAVLGSGVTVVGFGVTDGEAQTGAGAKRLVALTLDELDGQLIGLGDEDQNICQGDSGGPTFLDIDGTPTLIAVSSFGSNFCQNRSFATRTDMFADFIDEVVQAWSGPCQNDLNCVTEGCGTFADPDCGVCGLEGVCGQDCPAQDLDCASKGVPGSLCSDDGDCELGMCVDAVDELHRICSEPCDPEGDGADCSRALDSCIDGACQFSGIIPMTQGAECEEPDDCHSGICDTRHDICVEECEGSCPEPYSCETIGEARVCTFGGGGCCTLAPGRGGPVPWQGITLAGVVMLFLWRRRWKLR